MCVRAIATGVPVQRNRHRNGLKNNVDIIERTSTRNHGMTTETHDLAPGYYWYSQDNDPYCVLHVHENGSASLMGTDAQVSAHDVALMIARGCRFAWIEPPQLQP